MASSSTLKQHAYRYLREKIILGEIAPGTRLKEEVISRETGVSRGPIREAIRQLDSEGIVRHITHQGATVHAPSRDEVQELAELHASIEAGVAARAAQRAAPWVIDLLAREVQRTATLMAEIQANQTSTIDENLACALAGADLRFHGILMEAAASPRAIKILRDLRVLCFVWGLHRIDTTSTALAAATSAHREHQAIFEAVKAKDPALARSAMMEHLARSTDAYLQQVDQLNHSATSIPLIRYKQIRDLLLSFETQNPD
jgi:DNA-binding GntR family transcriptional regulator